MSKLNMASNTTNGLLITFCGLDGCGKTTMINKLVDKFEKEYPIILTKEPTDFVRKADIFRTFMDSPDNSNYEYRSLSLLAASDRLQHVNKTILPEMKKGKIVISDRYFYSCLANLQARGYEDDRWIYEIAQYIIKPDVSFFIDVPVEIAVNRVRSRPSERNRFIDLDLQHNLRKRYIEICEDNDGVLISSEQSIDSMFEEICDKLSIYMR